VGVGVMCGISIGVMTIIVAYQPVAMCVWLTDISCGLTESTAVSLRNNDVAMCISLAVCVYRPAVESTRNGTAMITQTMKVMAINQPS